MSYIIKQEIRNIFNFNNLDYYTYYMKNNFRQKLFNLIDYTDLTGDGNKNADYYDIFMMVIIILSIIPLLFKVDSPFFTIIEIICTTLFILDYFLRWATNDLRMKKDGLLPFLIYPFTFLAIIDLLSILPGFSLIFPNSIFFKEIKVLKILRLIRLVKLFRYSKSLTIIAKVFSESKSSLYAVGTLAISYILICSVIIFNVEAESFTSFFEALYWATMSLTAVGYGDLYPVTTAGRLVAMISAIFGIAIVALPAGIITAGFLKELNKNEKND